MPLGRTCSCATHGWTLTRSHTPILVNFRTTLSHTKLGVCVALCFGSVTNRRDQHQAHCIQPSPRTHMALSLDAQGCTNILAFSIDLKYRVFYLDAHLHSRIRNTNTLYMQHSVYPQRATHYDNLKATLLTASRIAVTTGVWPARRWLYAWILSAATGSMLWHSKARTHYTQHQHFVYVTPTLCITSDVSAHSLFHRTRPISQSHNTDVGIVPEEDIPEHDKQKSSWC